ncbi:hypothetical protein C8Q74DRAFT_73516 [Fomes fomentarius]|nr:hypothetical protein C8Q74DRAFT_73516 [Fomes fomentarius]
MDFSIRIQSSSRVKHRFSCSGTYRLPRTAVPIVAALSPVLQSLSAVDSDASSNEDRKISSVETMGPPLEERESCRCTHISWLAHRCRARSRTRAFEAPGTQERHSSNVIVNHNPTEDYMVEAWFQTQGLPAKVELKQNGNQRLLCGMTIYLILYAFETFINFQNAATGAGVPLVALQIISAVFWAVPICVLHVARGQGKRFINLNRLATAEYRCFQLVVSGKNVHAAMLSTHLNNVRDYNLFHSKYESKRLKAVGGAMVFSGIVDIFTTVLIVGLNAWAYGWLGLQVLFIIVKVVFSLEPIRRIPIVDVQPLVGDTLDQGPPLPATSSLQGRNAKTRLPIIIECSPEYAFREVCVTHNVVFEHSEETYWHSRTPGLFIGQPYYLQRPAFAEKPTAGTEENIPKLPHPHVFPSTEKRVYDSEKPPVEAADPAMFPLPPSPPIGRAASPTSSESGSTIIASFKPRVVTEVPRIIVSPESPATSPASPTFAAPPGIPVARSTSTRSGSTRAPTPPAKPLRAATLPPQKPLPASMVIRNGPPPVSYPRRPKPIPRTTSDTMVAHPVPLITSAAPKPKQETSLSASSQEPVRYLTLGRDERLTFSETEPVREANEALQREFLACLAEIVKANKVPSLEFLTAIETMTKGIQKTMNDNWYIFGTTDLLRYSRAAYVDLLWRRSV